MPNDTGSLVISLDFELLWGVFDKVDWREKKEYFQNTRKVIPQILQLFEKYKISCTWATVGMLFNESWEEWNANFPEILPDYENPKLSAYNFGDSIQTKNIEKLCFAPNLIKQIINVENQELATHTYSHYYCREQGQNSASFRADLELCISLAKDFGVDLRSLVFPRNQLNEDYLKICSDLGITSVRSNPDIWYWKDTEKDTLAQKIFRTGDAYIGLNDKPYKNSKLRFAYNLNIQPSSRLLRTYSGKTFLNKLKLERIKNEMTYAAKNKKVYHLWWHPHNFGTNPEKSLEELNFILKHFEFCRDKYSFRSLSMNGLAQKYL